MAHVSIQEAMQRVVNNPMQPAEPVNAPVYELVCRALFEIANNPDSSVRGSMNRANRARKLILDRMVGKRRPGSHPAQRQVQQVTFVDLTTHQLEMGDDDDD